MATPVNWTRFNADCPCDLEVELPAVPDEPVSLDDPEPDHLVRSLSDVPLQVRVNSRLFDVGGGGAATHPPAAISIVEKRNEASEEINAVKFRESSTDDDDSAAVRSTSSLPADIFHRNNGEEGRRREELSVKTLASMFDYKIGSVPYRPCSAKLEDSVLFQKAKRLAENLEEQSDC